jgi:hypothetical protein
MKMILDLGFTTKNENQESNGAAQSVVSCQWSVVSCQWSVVRGQWSVVSNTLPVPVVRRTLQPWP